MSDKVLSIVIPTYNMEGYLHKCLSSLVVEAPLINILEVLIINDGSKDKSAEIAQEYETKYPGTFRLINKENGNYGSCVNYGLREATGKYIKILDADDYFDNLNFSGFLSFLQMVDVDLVISDFQRINPEGQKLGVVSYPFGSSVFTVAEFPKDISTYIAMHAVTYKTNNIRKIGYMQTEGISYTDLEWIYSPMITVERVLYYPHVVYNYLLGRSGQTMDSNVLVKNLWMDIIGIKKMLDQYLHLKDCVSNTHKQYLEGQLSLRISVLYRYYLLSTHNILDERELIDFDDYLKSKSSDIYSLIECYTIKKGKWNFPFISIWRKKQSRNQIAFWAYDFWSRIKGHIR